jgi:hypothetical protein
MDGQASPLGPAVQSPTTADPYALSPSTMAFIKSLQGLGSAIGSVGPPASANYMRQGFAPQLAQGQPNNLLATILQMRSAQTAGLGAPYAAGVVPPRVSLLNG